MNKLIILVLIFFLQHQLIALLHSNLSTFFFISTAYTLCVSTQGILWPGSVMGSLNLLHLGQKFEKFSFIVGPSVMEHIDILPQF